MMKTVINSGFKYCELHSKNYFSIENSKFEHSATRNGRFCIKLIFCSQLTIYLRNECQLSEQS